MRNLARVSPLPFGNGVRPASDSSPFFIGASEGSPVPAASVFDEKGESRPQAREEKGGPGGRRSKRTERQVWRREMREEDEACPSGPQADAGVRVLVAVSWSS